MVTTQKLTRDYIVYNTQTLGIVGRFFLVSDAARKMRKYNRCHYWDAAVAHVVDMTDKQWIIWRTLQAE